MFQKQQCRDNLNFYHKFTQQFKDNTLVFRFLFPMSQHNINAALVWSQLSDDRNEQALTKHAMIRWMDELYDASYGSYITTYGQSFALSVVFKGIEGQFVNDPNQNKAFLTWAFTILQNVLINEETCAEAKRNVLQGMKREQENHVKYAIALSAQRFENTPYALKVDGDERVNELSIKDLKAFHESLFNAPCDIFHVGQLGEHEIINAIINSSLNQDKSHLSTYTCLKTLPLPRLSVRKISPQTIFVKTYATHIDYADPRYLAMRLGAIALGSLPTSLLFSTIREKHSLCYFIHASVIAFDGVMNIITGIDAQHVDRVAQLIDEQIHAINDVDDDLISQAKLTMIHSLVSSDDDVMSSINLTYSSSLKQEDFDIEAIIKRINTITKHDIIDAMAQCEPLSEFVLLGENHV